MAEIPEWWRTPAFMRFWNGSQDYFQYVRIMLGLAANVHVTVAALKRDDPRMFELFSDLLHEADVRRREWYLEVSLDLMVVRSVDQFLYYMTDVIALLLRARPELAAEAGEQIRPGAILVAKSLREAQKEAAMQTATALSYRGYKRMLEFIRRTLKVEMTLSSDEERSTRILLASRNALTHNGGIVSQKFINESGLSGAEIGQRIPLDRDEAIKHLEFLRSVAETIDVALLARFGTEAFSGEIENAPEPEGG